MKKEIRKHFEYYISMIVILLFGTVLAYLTIDQKQLQFLIIMLTIFFYVAWGLLHHYINHDMTAKIVIEYVLVGSLGMSILFFLSRSAF